jgi:hypothetical protein
MKLADVGQGLRQDFRFFAGRDVGDVGHGQTGVKGGKNQQLPAN